MSILDFFDSGGLDLAYGGGGGFGDFDLGEFGFGEFGGFPDFDFGQIDFPDFYNWGEFAGFPDFGDLGDYGFGEFGGYPDLGGLTFDTATGQITLPSGQAFDAAGLDLAYGGGGGWGAPVGGGPGGGGGSGVLAGTSNFLSSPLGRALQAGVAGALGLGATKLLAGPEPRLQMPMYAESPETLALRQAAFPGQMGLAGQMAARVARESAAEAEQAPMERDVRLAALGKMGGYLPGGPEDAIVAGLRAEAIRALRPDYTDPLVEESIRLSQEELMNRLQRQYGGLEAAQTSTPGIDVMGRFAAQRGLARAGARREAIGAYAPAAISAESGIQDIRRRNLSDIGGLSGFGLRGAGESANILGGLAGDRERANLYNLGMQGQGGLAAYDQALRRREQLAQGIGGITGQIGSILGQQPSWLEQYLRKQGMI